VNHYYQAATGAKEKMIERVVCLAAMYLCQPAMQEEFANS